MKKLFLFIGLVCSLSLMASIRTADQALQIVNAQPGVRKGAISSAPMRLYQTWYQADGTTPAIYIFQRDDAGGFVMVSAETETQAIIAYSDTDKFMGEQIPDNLRFWLDRYAHQITLVGQQQRQQASSTQAFSPVEPLMKSQWNQYEPFNNACPKLGGYPTLTGCVAVAIAQIMYYYQYPAKGRGSHSYTWNSTTLSADFGATTYDWKNMLVEYNGSETQVQKNAVATLLYHAGVSCNMNYGTMASSGSLATAVQSLITYFDFDSAIVPVPVYYWGTEYTLNTIAEELAQKRPVLMDARTPNGDGHAFICDGIDADGQLHINWGWGGLSDGYYAFTLMNPTSYDVRDAYSESVLAYIGVQPNQQNPGKPVVVMKKLEMACESRIAKSTPVSFNLNTVRNIGVAEWKGTIGIKITDKQGQLIGSVKSNWQYSLAMNHFYTSLLNIGAYMNTLTLGEYILHFIYTYAGSSDMCPILRVGNGPVMVPMTVTQDSIFLDYENVEIKPVITHTKCINQNSTNLWELELPSETFFSELSAGEDILLKAFINSGSNQSVMGTYTYPHSPTDGVGSILSSNLKFIVGQSSSGYTYTPTKVELTFSVNANKELRLDYYIVANNQVYRGADTIAVAEQDWWRFDGEFNYNYPGYSTDLVCPLSVSEAISKGNTLSANAESPVMYLIQGAVTAVAPVDSETRSITLATDMAGNNALIIDECRWTDNTPFDTNKSMSAGDKATVLARLYKDAGGNLKARGWVYQNQTGAAGIPSVDIDVKTPNANKVLYNGQLYILRNGQKYTIQGTIM